MLRRKYRKDRRPGFPIEPIWSFYPKFAWQIAAKLARALRLLVWIHTTGRRIQSAPDRHAYVDQALTPVCDDETEKLELFTHSEAARHAVEHAREIAHLTGAGRAGGR